MAARFEVIAHPADVGVLAHGESPGEIFENAAVVICSLACTGKKSKGALNAKYIPMERIWK